MSSRDFEKAADERAYRLKTAAPEVIQALRDNEQEGAKAISAIIDRQGREFDQKFKDERTKLYQEKNVPKIVPPWSRMRRTQKDIDRQAEINVKARDQREIDHTAALFQEQADRILGMRIGQTIEDRAADNSHEAEPEYVSAADQMDAADAKAQEAAPAKAVKVWTQEQIDYFKEIQAARIAENFNENAQDNTL